MYLFKYLSNCGVCSRRRAAELIEQNVIKINGKVVNSIFYDVQKDDVVQFNGKVIVLPEPKYILLNKPKDYITTLSDDRGRRTVVDLISIKNIGRIYPVGRLDRQTTGLLLFTNDGDLTQKLSHPSYNVQKGYRAVLDRPFVRKDFDKVLKGLKLEDGIIYVDSLSYVQGQKKNNVEVYIHSGRNRIVRRIFEFLGYKIKKLDRFYFAGLTKKGLDIGKWRLLNKNEVNRLKNLERKNKS